MGYQELLVIALIAVVVIGPKRLPDLGEAAGLGLRRFRQALERPSHPRSTP